MNRFTSAILALTATLLYSNVHAGTIEPTLQATLLKSAASDRVPVIIRFSDTVDLKAFRKDFAQSSKLLYTDRNERNKNRNTLKRAMLVHRMRDKAVNVQQPAIDLLKQRGQGGALKTLWSINALSASVSASVIAELAALPGVESVVFDAVVQGPGPSSAPTSPAPWNLAAIAAPSLWNLGYTGAGVVIATMDTGVDVTHPDLELRYRGGDNSWFDAYGQHAGPGDHSGHGTQVLGLIVGGDAGGWQIGVAPDAQWIAAKIFDDANEATISGMHAAFQWMLDPDGDPDTDDAPDIVNNSWVLANTVNECDQEFSADIALLKEAEIAIVYSGGNFGPGPDTSVAPANDTRSFAVGSVDDQGNVSNFSSRGPNVCDGGIYPHLVAPGDNLLTSEIMPSFYNVVGGTSFSVAHVSGAMAVLKGAFPGATVTELETALMESATDMGPAGPDNTFGYGMLNLAAAYDWLNGGGAGSSGSIEFSAASYSTAEDVATISVTVRRVGGNSGDVSVDFTTTDGSAVAGADYSATFGTLDFLDGETSQSFSVAIIDDVDLEASESFNVALTNATGGAAIGVRNTATVSISDNDSPPAPADDDGDGFVGGADCDDTNASVHAGAIEVKYDGVDQDCNGYDLTIDIYSATFNHEKALVSATSDLGSQANLTVTLLLADGSRVTRAMTWESKRSRWHMKIIHFTKHFGSAPTDVIVSGVEGEEFQFMNSITTKRTVTNNSPVNSPQIDPGIVGGADCDDTNASVHAGAVEVKYDGVDQDCNGYDLTIDIYSATFNHEKALVSATSDLGSQANLIATLVLADGSRITRSMTWQSKYSYWHMKIIHFTRHYGSAPVDVIVSGVEGEESKLMNSVTTQRVTTTAPPANDPQVDRRPERPPRLWDRGGEQR